MVVACVWAGDAEPLDAAMLDTDGYSPRWRSRSANSPASGEAGSRAARKSITGRCAGGSAWIGWDRPGACAGANPWYRAWKRRALWALRRRLAADPTGWGRRVVASCQA